MSKNGISTLQYKADRQLAKLEAASIKRAATGRRSNLDITELPTVYAPNDNNSYNRIDNPNTGGLVAGRPWTAGSPPPSGNDFGFTGDQNMWIINGGFNAGSVFSDPAPTNPAYTYPDNSYTGKTYNFDGTSYMIGANLAIGGAWQSNTITIDFWFLPTANGVQLLTELGQQNFVSPGFPGYHTTLLEITNTGNIKARFWQSISPGQVITSTNTVDLNKWNHIYFTEDELGNHSFELNSVPTTSNPSYTRATPLTTSNTNIHYAVGGSEGQNMGTTGGFQGKIGYLNIHDYPVGSTWTNTKARFRPTTYSVSIRSYDSSTATPGDVITTCNEGDTIWIQVDWTGLTVSAGLDSYLQLGGANITNQDISVMGPVQATDPIPFGSDAAFPGFDPAGGTTGSPILINADSTTEGNETLTWKWYVNNSEVATASCTIVDTSQDPANITYPDPGGLNGGLHDRTWDATWDQTFAWFGSHSTSFDQITYGAGQSFGQSGNPYGPATARLEGYFAPTQAGSYTFTLDSDNSAWVWVGNQVATASMANSNLSTGGITSITVSLVPGDFYPILVVYTQDNSGPDQAGFTLFASGTGITGSINSWPGDGYGWH